MLLVAAFHLKFGLHAFTQPEKEEYKSDETNESGKEEEDGPPCFIPDRQYHNLQYGWCAVPLAVIVGSFHHKAISALWQVVIGDGTLIGEIVPFFVITIQFISKSVVFAGNVVRYDKFQRERRLPGFQRDAFRIADVYLCGSLVCGVSSSAIVVAAELQRKRNDGRGLCTDCL